MTRILNPLPHRTRRRRGEDHARLSQEPRPVATAASEEDERPDRPAFRRLVVFGSVDATAVSAPGPR